MASSISTRLTGVATRAAREAWRLGLAIAGGLLAGPALPRQNLWWAIFASVFLIHLAVRGVGFWRGAGVGLFAGLTFYASQSIWMTAYLGPEPWLALAILEGLIFAVGLGLAAAVWNWLGRHRERLEGRYQLLIALWLPLIWIAREWVAAHFPYGGYQWSRLGQAVANTPLAHLAYFGGISLVSLAVVAISVGLLLVAEATWLSKKYATSLFGRQLVGALSLALILTALATTTGLVWKLNETGTGRQLKVVAIQGNANAGLFANPEFGSILAKHLAATNRYLKNHTVDYDLMVWPENSADVDPLNNPLAANAIQSLVAKTNRPLLVGAVTDQSGEIYNSGLLYLPGKSEPIRYDKLRPVPFGEYVPDRAFWRTFAPDLIDLIARGYRAGNRSGVMEFPIAGNHDSGQGSAKLGDLICFEIGIDEIGHDLVLGGANIIVSQANNADFGHTDQAFQQEALVRLQAITTGRAVVHASTVATTEIVGPHGKVLARTSPFTADWAAASIPLRKGITPAMRFFGWVDWLALAAAIAGALILLDLQILKILKRRPRELAATQSSIEPGLAAKTLVIMPTYNETESLERVANHLLATVPEVSLLIVDDNSPDGTGQLADKLAASNARVSVLHRQQKNGLGPAYLAGFAWGFERGFEYLVEMDADGSHRAEDLTQMLAQAEQNDLVIGSRWVPGGKIVNWPLTRQLISRGGNFYARTMLGAPIRDITAGFRVYRAAFLKSLDLTSVASAGYSFQVEMAWRSLQAKGRIVEVPITFVERESGYSKMSKRIVFEALARVTRWGFERI